MEVYGDGLKEITNGLDMSLLGADLPDFKRGRRLSAAHETSERRVLVIYTGGTIGMVKTDDGENILFYLFCLVSLKIRSFFR